MLSNSLNYEIKCRLSASQSESTRYDINSFIGVNTRKPVPNLINDSEAFISGKKLGIKPFYQIIQNNQLIKSDNNLKTQVDRKSSDFSKRKENHDSKVKTFTNFDNTQKIKNFNRSTSILFEKKNVITNRTKNELFNKKTELQGRSHELFKKNNEKNEFYSKNHKFFNKTNELNYKKNELYNETMELNKEKKFFNKTTGIFMNSNKKSKETPTKPNRSSQSTSKILQTNTLTDRIDFLKQKMASSDYLKFSIPKRHSNANSEETSLFLKEMNYKELEENELDHSFEIPSSSLNSIPIQSNEILLLKSIYQNRPPTIFFKYSPICGQSQDSSRVFRIKDDEVKDYDFNCRITSEKPLKCIKLALKSGGFDITDHGKNWNMFWGFVKPETLKNMNQYQKTNHFPGCWLLGRKDNLYRYVLKMKQKFEGQFDFLPKTYLLSSDYRRFMMIRQNSDNKALWIMKPVNSACGRGVKVVNKLTKIQNRKDYLVSDYIPNPHLINELKYDLRVYVLITSFDPLRVYFYKEGLVRFATEKYTLNSKKIKKRFIHLTNYSVNKKAIKYKNNDDCALDDKGSKWSLAAYKKKLFELGINSVVLFEQIYDLIIKVCISVESFMLSSINRLSEHRNNCFELFGFDVLIDSNLKPWLMEVNVSPSLSSSSPLDARIKTSLMTDIFNLVGFKIYNKKKINEGNRTTANDIKRNNITRDNYNELCFDNCLNKLTSDQWNILFENEEEYSRRGQFERIFPQKENIENYALYFEVPTVNNLIWWKFLKAEKDFLQLICKKDKFN